MPKNISLPTKKVGTPKTPRATAAAVLSASVCLTGSVWAAASRLARIEAGGVDRALQDLGIVELQPVLPHAPKAHLEKRRPDAALRARRCRPRISISELTGKCGFMRILVELVPGGEALDLQHLVFELALDRREGDERRLVAGRLEDAAEQAGIDVELRPGALEDRRQRPIGEIGVGAGEVEDEFDGRRHHQISVQGLQVHLEGPGAALLAMEPDIVFRDRVGNQDLFARALFGGVGHQAADEGAVDRPVDDDMGDMHALRPEFARQTLRQRPQSMLGAGEGGKARAAADARGRAGEEHRPLPRGTITRAASRPARKPAKAAISQTLE